MITFIICIVLFFVLFFIGFATFLLQDIVEQSKAKDIQIDNAVKYEDLMYFQNKLNNTTDPIKREKIQKQIDLLEEAFIAIDGLYNKNGNWYAKIKAMRKSRWENIV